MADEFIKMVIDAKLLSRNIITLKEIEDKIMSIDGKDSISIADDVEFTSFGGSD